MEVDKLITLARARSYLMSYAGFWFRWCLILTQVFGSSFCKQLGRAERIFVVSQFKYLPLSIKGRKKDNSNELLPQCRF